MISNRTSINVFDPKDIAKRLFKSRPRDHESWRKNLHLFSEDQRYYIQTAFLQCYPADHFYGWFGLPAMLTILNRDPLLASLHNPNVWLYALEKAYPTPIDLCSVLHAYWSSVALLRPSENFEPTLLYAIHQAISQTVCFLDASVYPWATGLTPAVLSFPEEVAMFTVPWSKALAATTTYTLQYRDLGCLQAIPIPYPILTVLIRIIEGGFFPKEYRINSLPWPTPDSAWTDDLRLSLHAVSLHEHLRYWWVLPNNEPELPAHLKEAALMLDIGVQLNYLAPLKTWIQDQVP
jgi:hypothetical protein